MKVSKRSAFIGRPKCEDQRAGFGRRAALGAVGGWFFAIVLLAVAKGFPVGPWVPLYDDALWLAMTKWWCGGGRLYLDFWDNKPPGFFLYMRPLCWARPPDAGLTVGWEPLIFHLPIVLGNAFAIGMIGRAAALSFRRAVIFGFCAGALIWNGRMGTLFSTESLAACWALLALAVVYRARTGATPRNIDSLVVAVLTTAAAFSNPKFAAFGALYFVLPNRRWKDLPRDALAAAALAAVLILAVTGTKVENISAIAATFRDGNYVTTGFVDRLRLLFDFGFVSTSGGLFALAYPPLRWLGGSLGNSLYLFLCVVLIASIVYWHARRATYLIPVLLLSLASIVAVGTVFAHTCIQILPIFVVAGIGLFKFEGRRGRFAVALAACLAAASVAFDFGDKHNAFATGREAAVKGEARALSAKFSDTVGDRRWISLLANGYPVWLAQGVQRPTNSFFINLCAYHYPQWAMDEVTRALDKGDVDVVLHSRLAEPDCYTAAVIRITRERCALIAEASDPWYGGIEFRRCTLPAPPRITSEAAPTPPVAPRRVLR